MIASLLYHIGALILLAGYIALEILWLLIRLAAVVLAIGGVVWFLSRDANAGSLVNSYTNAPKMALVSTFPVRICPAHGTLPGELSDLRWAVDVWNKALKDEYMYVSPLRVPQRDINDMPPVDACAYWGYADKEELREITSVNALGWASVERTSVGMSRAVWFRDSMKRRVRRITFLHELGHFLGLSHASKGSVMLANVDPRIKKPSKWEVARVWWIWAGRIQEGRKVVP